MRPDFSPLEDKEDLAISIRKYTDNLDGRLGVFLGFLNEGGEFDMLFQMNASEKFASASVIKIAVLYSLYEKYDGHLMKLNSHRDISKKNKVRGSGIFHLFSDPSPTLEDLAQAMIAISDNSATNELIDEIGRSNIETTIDQLGMKDTHLRRKMMVELGDNDLKAPEIEHQGKSANETTPADCARFFEDVIHEKTLSSEAYSRLQVPLHEQKYKSQFTRYLPFDLSVAHKTGTLPTASLDTGFITAPELIDDPLVFAVFADSLENSGDGSDVIAEIGSLVYRYIYSRS